MKIIFSDNSLCSLLNFRGAVIRRLAGQGHDVVLVAPDDGLSTDNIPAGVRHMDIRLSRTGMNPFKDIVYMLTLRRIYRAERPDYIFHFTIKPNIYGTLAARCLGIRSSAMVAGVGHVFTDNGVKNGIARALYRLAMHHPERVMVLNASNRDTLVERGVVASGKILLLTGGEGLELDLYTTQPMPSNDRPVFLMIARLLYEKGYAEFVAAAEILRGMAEFRIMGPLDDHPAAVQREALEVDVERGTISYIEFDTNVTAQIAAADCVVLPSYHEGLSRVLMEGAAMGRPLITTDIAGCREAVDEGVNGWLVTPKSVASLADACGRFIALTPDQRARMGAASRLKAERLFSVEGVYAVYEDILNGARVV